MSIEFGCAACGKRYRVKDEFAGKRARCKACGHVTEIPRPEPAPVDDPAGLSSFLDEELVADTSSTPSPPSGDAQCPSCEAKIESGAVVCMSCGFDQRTGEKLSTLKESEELSKAAAAPEQSKSNVGRFIRGTVLSAIGALIGAGIWAAVALGVGVESGWIAWAVGILAGGGMAIGYQGSEGMTSGIVAACVALGAIIVAKIMIVSVLLEPLAHFDPDDMDAQRRLVENLIVDTQLQKEGLSQETADTFTLDAALNDAAIEVAAMTDEEVAQRYDEFMDQTSARLEADFGAIVEAQPDFEEADRATAAAEGIAPKGAEGVTTADDRADEFRVLLEEEMRRGGALKEGAFGKAVFASMTHPINVIFVLLAVVTAYKIGSAAKQD